MAVIEDLKSKYLKKLESFPFETEEEAIELGVKNFRVNYENQNIALETPFSMRVTVEKQFENHSTEDSGEEDDISNSSEGESTDSSDYDNDLLINIDLSIKSKIIVEDCELKIVRGRKYGLVGRNGIGKTTLLKAIRKRKFGISKGLKIHMIEQESNINVPVEEYVGIEGGKILSGLGFTKHTVTKKLQSLSGGWRMRAHLAKAININPDLLLLDEPTNYLDIKALTWLENQIRKLKTVIIVSHDKNFLNNTVDEILHLNDLKIEAYKGNYDGFLEQRKIRLDVLEREYENQLRIREHLQSFIDRFRYNAKRASLAQSKIKMLAKMPDLIPPKQDPKITFKFDSTPSDGTLIEFQNVYFTYNSKKSEDNFNMEELKDNLNSTNSEIKNRKEIFKDLNIKINSDSRIIIVGENGKGKSTFLKLLTGNLEPTAGYVIKNSSLSVGYFAQHHVDHLNVKEKVLNFMMKNHTQEESRRALAGFGLNVENQRIGTLSGGQKSRMAMAIINAKKPNLLVLDEPTNHLDMESIDALAEALRNFKGAVICVSHDLNFVSNVFTDIFICENNNLIHFNGDIFEYKKTLNQ